MRIHRMRHAGFKGLLVAALSAIILPAAAAEGGLKQQFLRFDPATRLEQLCDYEAMLSISHDRNRYNPDKVIAYTFGEPLMSEDTLVAPGAVFRSRGDWYRLSFKCKADVEHVEIQSLKYEIGKKVPREKWTKYFLYD